MFRLQKQLLILKNRNGLTNLQAAFFSAMKNGTVKWFDSKKGFGFIIPEDGTEDVFVHQTCIHADGFRSLAEGEPVEFTTMVDDRGKIKAERVTGPMGAFVQGAPKRMLDSNFGFGGGGGFGGVSSGGGFGGGSGGPGFGGDGGSSFGGSGSGATGGFGGSSFGTEASSGFGEDSGGFGGGASSGFGGDSSPPSSGFDEGFAKKDEFDDGFGKEGFDDDFSKTDSSGFGDDDKKSTF